MKPVVLVLAVLSVCHGQSSPQEVHSTELRINEPTSNAVRLIAGPLKLDIYISETAQLFHVVDQISRWSEFCHPQYLRYFRTSGTVLTESELKMLAEHVAVRTRYGWGHGPDQVFYTPLPLGDALKVGVMKGYLTSAEAETERRVLTSFKPRVDQLVADAKSLNEFVHEFRQQLPTLTSFAVQVAQFVGGSPPEPIPFYVIANPDDTSMGGGYNGGTLTLEIPRKRDVYPTVLHELFHAFVETKRREVERTAASVPGLDFMTLNEGLAYAISPGLYYTGDSDQLLANVSSNIAKGSSLSDAFTRFNYFGLALRPLLRKALADSHQNLESFLPRAVDVWLVIVELDRAGPRSRPR